MRESSRQTKINFECTVAFDDHSFCWCAPACLLRWTPLLAHVRADLTKCPQAMTLTMRKLPGWETLSIGDICSNASVQTWKARLRKRIKLTTRNTHNVDEIQFPLQPLLSALHSCHSSEDTENNFEQVLNPFLQDFCRARLAQENELAEQNEEVVLPAKFLLFY